MSEARSGECWTQRLHCRSKNVNFWVWGVGERKSTDRMKRRKEGGGTEERDEHIPLVRFVRRV